MHAFGVPAGALGVYGVSTIIPDLFVRLMVDDQPGVFAEIAAELAKHEISIEGVIQRPLRDRSRAGCYDDP